MQLSISSKTISRDDLPPRDTTGKGKPPEKIVMYKTPPQDKIRNSKTPPLGHKDRKC